MVHRPDLSVSALGSSTFNAAQISAYLQRQFAGADRRRYIVFAYSKGAADVLEAMAADGIARTGIAAIVTVAGSVLGSRLAQGIPNDLLDVWRGSRFGTCDVADGGGIDSLRRAPRVAAMAAFTMPAASRGYSLAAITGRANVSVVLRNGWDSLSVFSLEQDSQMIHEDAIIPGGTYLGIARGDHWAVALPFEDAGRTQQGGAPPVVPVDPNTKALLDRLIDRNHYPRVALFESALRFVEDDLARQGITRQLP